MSGLLDDIDLPANPAPPGGDCVCGRARVIGTCRWTEGRLWFRAFHDGPAIYHYVNAANWACAECVADAAEAVASGEVREDMRLWAQEHRAAIAEGAWSSRC